ncbi:MAG: hypothetical protein FWG47_03435, partial [Propionibacteriaceae bacterium]|nr:hypothetical protein [Propionibacteriaceae bacterium]
PTPDSTPTPSATATSGAETSPPETSNPATPTLGEDGDQDYPPAGYDDDPDGEDALDEPFDDYSTLILLLSVGGVALIAAAIVLLKK